MQREREKMGRNVHYNICDRLCVGPSDDLEKKRKIAEKLNGRAVNVDFCPAQK